VNLASEPTYQTKQAVILISQKLIKNNQATNRSSVLEFTATVIGKPEEFETQSNTN
jgi:outer membrane receptor for monomeric catechols